VKIGILSRNPHLYSTRRLREAAKARGHEVRVVDYLRCFMRITPETSAVFYGGEELEFNAVIPRIGATYTFYGTAVLRQFEMLGVVPANGSQAITRARDKLRCHQILAREKIGMPVTGFAHSTRDIDGLIEAVGGAPMVVKLLEGTQGIGVVLAETKKAAESVIAAFRQLDANMLAQEFIREAKGVDYRAFVVGSRVIAAMRRRAQPGEFRSNLHRGGESEAVKLTDEEQKIALRSVRALGLQVAGVDMLRTSRGPMVLEVNSSPGLEGIEGATKIDVATKIIAFLEKTVAKGGHRDRVQG
jgi:ribosomal protein S6--L-glutamate ligase